MHFFNRLIRLLSTIAKESVVYFLCAICMGFILPSLQSTACADELVENKVKAAFIYNFMAFTQWPEDTGQTLNLCIYGEDYFGHEIDKLENKSVNNHQIKVIRTDDSIEQLQDCQVIFFSKSVGEKLPALLATIQNKPILTLADSPGAAIQGVAINMALSNEKIVFEINLSEARSSGLNISARLLNLAVKVYQ
ncbi:YfiR family protein [Nitrosomonas aestuarii]|uniref:YfiR family protein n=1 Tax=Nitrosomonas aestuarii TaxID=52441 RepID=A0A1I3Z3Q5_9PROT|nr:YfiR family protein [Nitrosomonas aestuarii]PTN11072.1 uncharacterized protein DUF4154 [Nitrosomonas aestuarii]SFK38698.1 protein of unknown function [Nitrosomonas aestuarii]